MVYAGEKGVNRAVSEKVRRHASGVRGSIDFDEATQATTWVERGGKVSVSEAVGCTKSSGGEVGAEAVS